MRQASMEKQESMEKQASMEKQECIEKREMRIKKQENIIKRQSKNVRKQTEDAYLYWLCRIEGIGSRKMKALLQVAGSAERVYEMKEELIDGLAFLNERDKLALTEAKRQANVLREYQNLEGSGIRFLTQSCKDYPQKLKCIPDPPHVLFVKGKVPDWEAPTVAVIGARECSEYGRYVAMHLGRHLAAEGIRVVSGLARGIDGIAQKGALEAGGEVYGVLGCGVDICYPRENKRI